MLWSLIPSLQPLSLSPGLCLPTVQHHLRSLTARREPGNKEIGSQHPTHHPSFVPGTDVSVSRGESFKCSLFLLTL